MTIYFVRVFAGADSLVLWPNELATYPQAQAFIEANFELVYRDAYWSVWDRTESVAAARSRGEH